MSFKHLHIEERHYNPNSHFFSQLIQMNLYISGLSGPTTCVASASCAEWSGVVTAGGNGGETLTAASGRLDRVLDMCWTHMNSSVDALFHVWTTQTQMAFHMEFGRRSGRTTWNDRRNQLLYSTSDLSPR